MPAPPVLRDRTGGEGAVKILHDVDSQQARAGTSRFEESLSVSAHPDRPVHEPAPAMGTQEKRHFVDQGRKVRLLLPTPRLRHP